MRRTLAVAVALVAACGGGGGGGSAEPKQPTVDEAKAEKDAKGLVREIYQTLNRSANTDGLMPLLAEPLVVFGPRRSDAHATRSDALVAMRAVLDERGKDKNPSLASGSLAVVASPGGLSAFAVDVVNVDGSPMAMTAVLANEDDFWVVVAASLARMPAMRTVRQKLEADAVVPPAMAAPAKVTDQAEDAAGRFKRGLADPSSWADDLAKRSDAVVIGPAAGEITKGKKAVAAMWKKRAKANVRYAAAGDIAAATTPDGKLAWVTLPAVQFADDDEPLPLRLFGVYERTGDSWQLVALQEALAIDEPGAGANFKKVTPPAVKEEPPPPPKDEPKKKKKRKKKSSDDD